LVVLVLLEATSLALKIMETLHTWEVLPGITSLPSIPLNDPIALPGRPILRQLPCLNPSLPPPYIRLAKFEDMGNL
jgi:hypothetical protein